MYRVAVVVNFGVSYASTGKEGVLAKKWEWKVLVSTLLCGIICPAFLLSPPPLLASRLVEILSMCGAY